MTEREAKAFLNNLKVCIEEHPIVADWLVEIADRKTENSSEKPNNSTISKMEQVDGECADCKWHDKEWWYIKCDGCSRLHSHFEPKDEPQIGEMMTEEEFDSMLARVLTGNNEPQTERSK